MRIGRRFLAIALVLAAFIPTHRAAAQMIAGAVEDSAGKAIPGAVVSILGTDAIATTDSLGRFAFAPVRVATHILQVRRLGFSPVTAIATLRGPDTLRLSIELTWVATSLETFRVEAVAGTHKLNRVGFVSRRLHAAVPASRFITRAEFERNNPTKIGQIVNRMGGFSTRCPNARILVDGIPWPAPVNPERLAALDALEQAPSTADPYDVISPAHVEAIEVYAGPSEVPPQFSGAQCLVLIWTRE